jgi:hypothetical protein
MKPIDIRLLSAAVLFVLIVISGIWLTRSGKPLNPALLAIHKLLALGCLVLFAFIVSALLKGMNPNQLIITSIVFNVLFFIIMFATGVLLSLGKPLPVFVLTVHRIVTAMTLLAMAAMVFLLKR